jgi:hypothetical protein
LALLAFKARDDAAWFVVFALPALVGCMVGLVAIALVARGNPEPFTLEDIRDLGSDVVGYVGSYLLAAVVDVGESFEQNLVVAIALGLIIQIHIATGKVFINPLLYLVGYRVYEATTDTGVTYYLLARTEVSDWSGPRPLVQLGASLLVERPTDTKPSGFS